MNYGFLSGYFEGVGSKRLARVEIDPGTSNQHEFNGVTNFRQILGSQRRTFTTQFIYLGDDEDETVEEEGFLTWYDARENHPSRTEFRFYFPTTAVSEKAEVNDLLIVCRKPDDNLLVLILPSGSTAENQLIWLFNLREEEIENRRSKIFEDDGDIEIEYAGKYLLERLGFEVVQKDERYLEDLLSRFGERFPKTKEFSKFARETCSEVDPIEYPDDTLTTWLKHEETLFRTLEEYIVQDKLDAGFESVDEFISFSLSVHNRRKSRVGYAFEHHLKAIFDRWDLMYSYNKMTENRNKPDFIFPDIEYYRDDDFSENLLTMLGVKSTCKDRWRQVLSEADRIELKHLITLEPKISRNQTEEMKSKNLQLVVPNEILESFDKTQKNYLINLKEYINLVRSKQEQVYGLNT